MAVSFDASGSVSSSGSQTSWAHTIGAISDGCLIVGAGVWQNGGSISLGNGTVQWVTSGNTQALTKVTNSVVAGTAFWSEQWYLVNPTTGAGTVKTFGTNNFTTNRSSSSSWAGVNQTTPIDVNGTRSSTANPITGTLTTTADGEYIIDILMHASANAITPAAGQTSILNVVASGVSNGASYRSMATAGAGTMSWTSPGGDSAFSFLALKASGGAAVARRILGGRSMMGIGN